jgi:hypothetical protein
MIVLLLVWISVSTCLLPGSVQHDTMIHIQESNVTYGMCRTSLPLSPEIGELN